MAQPPEKKPDRHYDFGRMNKWFAWSALALLVVTLSKEVADEIRRHFSRQVFDTVVPRNVRLAEAPSFGRPILAYDIKSRGAEAYLALAREVLERAA